MPIGHEAGGHVEGERLLDLVQQVERVAAFASRSLTKVKIGRSRSRPTSKSLRVCSSMPLGAIGGGVEHHHRTVDCGQRAVGVLAEIFGGPACRAG